MPHMPHLHHTPHSLLEDQEALKHSPVYDIDGQRVGTVTEVYLEYASRRPEWLAVRLTPPGPADTFVPLQGAEPAEGGGLRLPYTLERLAGAPRENADQHLGLDQEQELYRYYGLAIPEVEPSGAPGVGDQRPKVPLTEDEELPEVAELSPETSPEEPRLRLYVPEGQEQTPHDPAAAGEGGDEAR
ncbi:PRC-barrel domain-containing protein [Streptomyces sp. NBC_01190]|uniref:PRC-barrel domain-containing protein n=1 Tax=Streptomyces sp. NBC_01190 TaxID=2903767 RepID=UPI00386394C3|nr:PRC-barrel domain-containing protein [Streptomyces sp. NBC_01190]